MKVTALKPHTNLYGKHAKGDIYNHARPETDIAFGYIEPYTEPAAEPEKKPKKIRGI